MCQHAEIKDGLDISYLVLPVVNLQGMPHTNDIMEFANALLCSAWTDASIMINASNISARDRAYSLAT